MVVAWALFPLVLVAGCLGCGLLVERLTGWQLSGALLPPVGLALIIVASALTTAHVATAPITTALVVVLALAGYAVSWRRLARLRLDHLAVAVGLATFAIGAAPVVLSGNATFLGYFIDSDPSFHFILANWLLAHGRDLASQPIPSYSAFANALHEYIGGAYPTGADVAVGALRPLVGQDIAWVYQPYLAVVMALLAVALDELLKEVVPWRTLRALSAFIAAQGALTYGFYLEASVKELVVALLLVVTVVLVLQTLRRPIGVRALVPLAAVGLGALDVYSVTVVPWLGPPLAVFAAVALWQARHAARRTRRRLAFPVLAWPLAGIGVILLATPVLSGVSTFTTAASNVLSQENTLGNLAAPLSAWQVLGIWPSGDFRYPITTYAPAGYGLMGVALAGAVLGGVWMLRRRAYAPLLLLAGNGVAAAYLLSRASPYAASKVLMLLSVPILVTGMLGATALHESGRRIEGWLVAALIAGGVLWTNFLAYHDSSVAPQGRLHELAAIGTRFSGQGPAFYNLWDTFAAYFLRQERAAAPDTFAGPVPLLPGAPPHTFGQPSSPWDLNELDPSFLLSFRLLILGRSPIASRPPANFDLVYRGRYYDVWRRTPGPRVLRHVPLTIASADPSPPPSCHTIMATAALAQSDHARLAYVTRPSLPALVPTKAGHPPYWPPTTITASGPPDYVAVGQAAGLVTGTVRVAASGRYQVWLGGSFSRRVTVSVGGQLVGSLRHEISNSGQYLHVGTVNLTAGPQPVSAYRPQSTLAPGNVLGGDMLGPLVLVPEGFRPQVQEITPVQARSLCGKPLEWLEIVG